ncbi:MAG: PA14 domain-containing protein, partial [Kiritimatiellia bacterium]
MRQSPSMFHPVSKWLGLCGLVFAGFLPAETAQAGEMAFEVKIKPTFPAGFEIAIKNETREPISGITLAIGSSTSRFLKLESVAPGGRILEPVTDPGDTGVVREEWHNLNGEYTIASLSNQTANYTTSPNVRTLSTGLFEAPTNVRDRYGIRMQGYFIPSVSGNYRFWISSDDHGELRLNGNVIASVPSYSTSRQWDKFPSQQSGPQALTAGQRYLVSAYMKEVGGGDNLAVGITLPN